MFIRDTSKDSSNLTLETDKEISIYEILDEVCGSDEILRFRLLDEQKNLRPHVNIFVGDRNCRFLNGIDTPVSAGDEISVFPSLSGG